MDHRLILIRHATTTAPENTLVGKNDVPLSAQGKQDALLLKNNIRFNNEKKNNVYFYCSMLSRAIQTAEILFPDTSFAYNDALNEADFGDWTGQDMKKILKKFPNVVDEWVRNPMEFRFPGGESVRECIDRVEQFLNVEALNKPGTVVLVCHGGIIRFIICRILGIDYFHHHAFSINRPSVNVIDHDGKNGVLAGLNISELTI